MPAWRCPKPLIVPVYNVNASGRVSDDADNYNAFLEYSATLVMPTIFLTPIPFEFVALGTPAMMHILASIALRHHIYRVVSNAGVDPVKPRFKFCHHCGKVITALNDMIQQHAEPVPSHYESQSVRNSFAAEHRFIRTLIQ